jgi:hypothetical protein
MLSALARVAEVRDVAVEPYWKVLGKYVVEVTFVLSAGERALPDLLKALGGNEWQITNALPEGWEAVWNRRGTDRLRDRTASWAYVEVIPETT